MGPYAQLQVVTESHEPSSTQHSVSPPLGLLDSWLFQDRAFWDYHHDTGSILGLKVAAQAPQMKQIPQERYVGHWFCKLSAPSPWFSSTWVPEIDCGPGQGTRTVVSLRLVWQAKVEALKQNDITQIPCSGQPPTHKSLMMSSQSAAFLSFSLRCLCSASASLMPACSQDDLRARQRQVRAFRAGVGS